MLTCKYSTIGKVGIGCTYGKMYTLRSSGSINKNQGKAVKDVDYSRNPYRYLYWDSTDSKVWIMDTNEGASLLCILFMLGMSIIKYGYGLLIFSRIVKYIKRII